MSASIDELLIRVDKMYADRFGSDWENSVDNVLSVDELFSMVGGERALAKRPVLVQRPATGRSPLPADQRVALTLGNRDSVVARIKQRMYPVVFDEKLLVARGPGTPGYSSQHSYQHHHQHQQHQHLYHARGVHSSHSRMPGGEAPIDSILKVEWSVNLNKTAGLTKMKTSGGQRKAVIQLASKVLDTSAKLWNTFAHELCHAAVWLNHGENKPPHGPQFKKYGRLLEAAFNDLEVKTTHDYEIDYRYQWTCQGCGHVFGRHSRSIDVARQRCQCQGRLVQTRPKPRGATPAKQIPPRW